MLTVGAAALALVIGFGAGVFWERAHPPAIDCILRHLGSEYDVELSFSVQRDLAIMELMQAWEGLDPTRTHTVDGWELRLEQDDGAVDESSVVIARSSYNLVGGPFAEAQRLRITARPSGFFARLRNLSTGS